jgi:uncharacterized membrane protein YoaK (UPF0700 family)
MLVKHRGSWPWPSAVGTIQIVELTVLTTLLAAWRLVGVDPAEAVKDIFVAMSAIALGIQSAVVLDLPSEKPTTTYVTGMLTTFVTHLIQWLHLIEVSPPVSSSQRGEVTLGTLSLAGPWIYGLTWLTYLAGVLVGSLLFSPAHEMALVLPVTTLIVVILLGRDNAAPAATRVQIQAD